MFIHYEIDYSNILHFHEEKQCMIFASDQSKYMYKVPQALISREDIDFDNPSL
ncbi:hypothetical protein [Flavobacterium cheongpyeongense]|nr:hypothetical protein [Flavobacterium cheongpyeongense]